MQDFDANFCTRFETASSREWLETNGIGGYASSTVSGANTRRYHGLLIAATRPPLGRMVLLSKFEETLILDGTRYDLSCNQYPGEVYPTGFTFLTRFRLDPFPVWAFNVEGVEVEKSVFMIYGENSTVCQWKVKNKSEITNLKYEIELRPLIAFRNHHHLRHEDAGFGDDCQISPNLVSIAPYSDISRLYLSHNAKAVERQNHWCHNFEYAIEKERGFDYHEDLYQPCSLTFDLSETAVVIASTEPRNTDDVKTFEKGEIDRRAGLIETAETADGFKSQLVMAADQFIVSRGRGKSVIAGYPWFSDWGRDTMIALSGLTLATNRPEVARSILLEFSRHISKGMLPNRFPDEGETPDYNTVDATLWFFEAIRAYAEKTADYDLIRIELYEKLADIVDWHIRGTRYGIHVDTDGLLFAGEAGQQLTWMDAKIGDWVVTPRTGKPVEIQALWFNALHILADLAARFGDDRRTRDCTEMASIVSKNFNASFWNDQEKCLFDVVNGGMRDASVRPNQIFAVSLRHSMLDPDRARKVVAKVEAELLTPVGLRSLSPRDERYAPVYIGSPFDRDAAYHQGTVWGWLIGHFVDACRRVYVDDPQMEARVADIISDFTKHLSEVTLGQVSEIFDGDAPHAPRGCPAQAWSVAELLRISVSRSPA